jgi:hypothetical protein
MHECTHVHTHKHVHIHIYIQVQATYLSEDLFLQSLDGIDLSKENVAAAIKEARANRNRARNAQVVGIRF